jgi:hypothetical protein
MTMGKQVEHREDVAERHGYGKVIRFHLRETSVGKPNCGKRKKDGEVIELTRERIESMAKRSGRTKANKETSVRLAWFGCF